MKKKILAVFYLLFAVTATAAAQFNEPSAFKPSIAPRVDAAQGSVDFAFQVPAGYHITDLKNNFFSIELEKNAGAVIERVVFPDGTPYGEEKVFSGSFIVRAYLKTPAPLGAPLPLSFDVSYQICQEFPQELCYPPDQSLVPVTLPAGFRSSPGPDAAAATADAGGAHQGGPLASRLERLIRGQLSHASFLLFIFVFVAGFLASLTPCVYPVIPIIMGYVGGRSNGRKLKGFSLSLFFVLGLALVYSLLGVIAAKAGSLIGISFQNPVVVSLIAAIFIVMGLSLAGLFSIPVPAWVSAKLSRGHKSDIVGSMIVGGVSAIIAAPCVGPVLIALLSWISQSGNILLGFWLTFVFSLGMSVIFLVAGTFSGAISALPRGGHWMSTVKYFFAALLIAGGIYFLGNILSPWLTLVIWGVFLITLAVGLGLFRPQHEATMVHTLAKSTALVVLLCGAIVFYHGLAGRFFPSATTVPVVAEKSLPWLADLAQAREKARLENKRLMVDAWAEWCAACRELDEETFSRADVAESLRNYVLVKIDLTSKNTANEELRKSLAIIGMPTIIFFDPAGKELGRFSGFLNGSDFIDMLGGLN
ncbi:MAG: thioredoxin family protein [Candidatus Aminicenantes bacterium]|nr:thioredoxin family protein [Candidatus Aminicenantes bacterium]